MSRILKFIALCAVSMSAISAFAQHSGHQHSATGNVPVSAYAGEQTRSIKALSASETKSWLEGQGTGLARAAELIDAERKLDIAFADKSITPELLASAMRRIGELQAQIRDSHLQTHLKQTALLNAEQIASYASLRGYTN